MNLLQIAWRNMRQRGLSSGLTMLSLALGVGLTVLVLSVYGIISDAFRRNASVGYNLVVGAKGSPLQLTLNTVYFLSRPIENVPYSYYMEYLPQSQRQELAERFRGAGVIDTERGGRFAPFMGDGFAIPVALGDYFGRFRVIGTTPDFFEKLRHGPDVDQPFTFSQGRNFQEWSEEHEYFEAVVGWRVAQEMQVGIGDEFFPSHGDPEGHGHDQGFTIVGILTPTGTPNDRGAFVNLEGFYLMDGHAKPIEEIEAEEAQAAAEEASSEAAADVDGADEETADEGEAASEEAAGEGTGAPGGARVRGPPEQEAGEVAPVGSPRRSRYNPIPIRQREVTAILVRANPFFAARLQAVINKGPQAQAAAPVGEISQLMDVIVAPLRTALLAITVITCFVAAVGILVSIYNSMNDRRRDIAVMRALGARRDTVMFVILAESTLIAVLGGALGWVMARIALFAAGGMIERNTGVQVGLLTIAPSELAVLPLVLVLAALAGLLPALVAYRTDVSRSLSA